MTKHRVLALGVAVALAALLVLPAMASAAEASADFEARVNAQNKDMYSFTIDYDHIEYLSNSYADKPLMGSDLDANWGWAAADHNITISNTGALPFTLGMVATSEPSMVSESTTYTVPLAADSFDYIDSLDRTWAGGGQAQGKAVWKFTQMIENYPYIFVSKNRTSWWWETVPADEQVVLLSSFQAPRHWPTSGVADYNWGGTLIAAPVDPV